MLSRSVNRALDSSTYRLFAGVLGPHAAYRLLQSSVLRAHPQAAQTSSHDGEPPGESKEPAPREEQLPPSCHRSGVASWSDQHETPATATAFTATDLPQPIRPGHLLSRADAEPWLGKVPCPATVRLRPRMNQLARLPLLALGSPCRAASPALTRTRTNSTAPEAPSTVDSPRVSPGSSRRLRAGFPTFQRQPGASVTNIAIDPDGVGGSAGSVPRKRKTNAFRFPRQPQRPQRLLRLEQFVG